VAGQDLTDFIARLVALRRGCSLSHDHFLEGKIRNPSGRKDIAWYRADGQEMTEPDWHFPDARFVAFAIDGSAPALILLNAHFEPLSITVPTVTGVVRWRMEIDTTEANGAAKGALTPGDTYEVPARAVLMLLGEGGPETASER
jgi:glycogen operon protein